MKEFFNTSSRNIKIGTWKQNIYSGNIFFVNAKIMYSYFYIAYYVELECFIFSKKADGLHSVVFYAFDCEWEVTSSVPARP